MSVIRRCRISLLRVRRWLRAAFPLRDDGPIAEPWRRLAAASLDTLLVLLLATAVDARNLALLGSSEADAVHRLALWIALGAWLYVLFGWSAGATLGMRAAGICLANAAAPERGIGLKTALLRVIGYWAACLPVKGGLWPVLTHPLRQGWHDRIAGTVVIKRGRSGALAGFLEEGTERRFRAASEICGAAWPKPDLRLALRGWGYALAGVSCLAVGMTYPVAWHLGSRVAGAPGDSAIFLWAQWYIPEMLRRHLPLTHTVYTFYPADVSLAYSTMEWFNGFLAWPLSRWLNAVAVYNVLWLGSLTLCAFTSYVLMAAVTRQRAAAFALAPAFGLCPYFLVHGLGHANLISAEFLPPVALCVYAWLTLRRARYAMATGVFWALAGWCDLQFLLFGALMLSAFFCAYWWGIFDVPRKHRAELASLFRTQSAQAAALVACFGVGMSWLLVPLVEVKLHGDSRFTDRMGQYPAALSDYFAPNQLAALTPAERASGALFASVSVEDAVAPGGVVVALCALSLLVLPRRTRRGLMPWWSLLLAAGALSLGYVLTSTSALQSNVFGAANVLLAFPGNGFALPWRFDAAVQTGLTILGGSGLTAESVLQPIWLPYSWVWTILPWARAFRGTARLGALVDLSAAVLAAVTLGTIAARAGKRFGLAGGAAAAAFCLGALCWEYRSMPYPAFEPVLSPAAASLRANPAGGPVLEIPLADSPQCLIDQTLYRRPAFDGFLSRLPESIERRLNSNAFLVFAMRQGSESGVVAASARHADDRAQLRAGLAALYGIGLRDIILRTDQLGQGDKTADEALLRSFGAVKTADDHRYAEVFHLSAPPGGAD